MASPTTAETRLLDEVEGHVAALNTLLDVLERGLANARAAHDRRLIRYLLIEIAYQTEQRDNARCRRDSLRRELQRTR